MKLAADEVEISPLQSNQLALSQPGLERGVQEQPPLRLRRLDQSLGFDVRTVTNGGRVRWNGILDR
jgi:hypothetical protein